MTVTLGDGVLHYEVDETFVNHGGRIGEADYVFPLPRDAAFSDLKLTIDGELVSGETMDAQHARSIYEEIVRRQRDPALVEWMGYGMLRTRIFPILPGESKRVVVRFDQVAEREGDALRIDYVMGGPVGYRPIVRNASDADERPTTAWDPHSHWVPRRNNYGAPYSPTHELTLASHGGTNVVTARGDAPALTLLVPTTRANGKPAITLLANDDGRDDGFALINVAPPAASADVTPRDITFVLDVERIDGWQPRWSRLRAAGRQLLSSLDSRDRFRLIDFSTDVRSFRDGFVPASPENVRAALSYLASLSAQGSTNISGALARALQRGDDGDTSRQAPCRALSHRRPAHDRRDARRRDRRSSCSTARECTRIHLWPGRRRECLAARATGAAGARHRAVRAAVGRRGARGGGGFAAARESSCHGRARIGRWRPPQQDSSGLADRRIRGAERRDSLRVIPAPVRRRCILTETRRAARCTGLSA